MLDESLRGSPRAVEVTEPYYRVAAAGGVNGSIADLAIVCVDANAGVKVNTRRMWKFAEQAGLPCFIAVTRMDGCVAPDAAPSIRSKSVMSEPRGHWTSSVGFVLAAAEQHLSNVEHRMVDDLI